MCPPPRPFGCGLRACPELAEGVTVIAVRIRTVVDLGPVFSSFATVVATTTSHSEPQAENLGVSLEPSASLRVT